MKQTQLFVLLPVTVAFVALALWNGPVSLVALRFSNPIVYVVTGILGSYLLLQISSRLSEWRLASKLSYFGKNTVIILATHMFIVEIVRLFDYKLFSSALPLLGVMEGIVFGAIVIASMCVVIPFCNRYFYFLFGASRRR